MIDERLKIRIYGFMLLIADTSKHGKGFHATRGSIELRKVYVNGTWRVSQSCAGESLRHDNSRGKFLVIVNLALIIDSRAKLSGNYVSFDFVIYNL